MTHFPVRQTASNEEADSSDQDMECINAVMHDHFGCFWLVVLTVRV